MTEWMRQCIALEPLEENATATEFDVYMHQALYQIGRTDEFSTA
jgi:hypothetical protein